MELNYYKSILDHLLKEQVYIYKYIIGKFTYRTSWGKMFKALATITSRVN